MSTTVGQLFRQFGIANFQQISWGTKVFEKEQGIYVVSTSDNPEQHSGLTEAPLFDEDQIENWIDKLPNFRIDNIPACSTAVKNRLTDFWLPDESILYIGKAAKRKGGHGVGNRIQEYFRTGIGNCGPHSGGHWLKVLKNLNSFKVYYGLCETPHDIENKMIEFFIKNVNKETVLKLHDTTLPIPFANIKFKRDKRHGLKNQTNKNSKGSYALDK